MGATGAGKRPESTPKSTKVIATSSNEQHGKRSPPSPFQRPVPIDLGAVLALFKALALFKKAGCSSAPHVPAPSFNAGVPETAPPAILARLRQRNSAVAAQRRDAVEAASARLPAS